MLNYFNNEMKTKIRESVLLLIFILTTGGWLLAYSDGYTQTIRGMVIDGDSEMPIVGANVVVSDTDPLLGASTDINGNFRIEKVPVGRHQLEISSIGYENKTLPNILVGSGKEVVVTIGVAESFVQLEELVIRAKDQVQPNNHMALVSARSISVDEADRYAATFNDPARMVSALPSVTVGSDDSNEIIVRGNSPRGLLWRMEGIEIPNPNHFTEEGSASGGISILSSNVLGNTDFFTGAWPAEYGNAFSGVFDISLRNGNNEKREYTFQAGILGIEAAMEGPFKKGHAASYLLDYRFSTLTILSELVSGLGDENEILTYQDLSFKTNIPTRKAGTFSLWGIGGLSKEEEDFSNGQQNYHSDMGALGLSHQFSLDDRTYIKSILSLSGTRITDDEDRSFQDGNFFIDNESFKKTSGRVLVSINRKFNAKHFVSTGVIYNALGFNFSRRIQNSFNSPQFQDFTLFDENGTSGLTQGFVSWKFRLAQNLTMVNGLHYMYFDLSQASSLEPRTSLRWQFKPNQSLSAGFGIHSKIENLQYYFSKSFNPDGTSVQLNRDLDLSKARHYVIGYDNRLMPNLHLKLEAYYQSLYDIPVVDDTNSIFSVINQREGYDSMDLENEGTGTNYGVELTLQRFFSNRFYFMVAGSLYDSKYKSKDGINRNTRFNGNFNTNFLLGKNYQVGKKDNILAFNVRTT